MEAVIFYECHIVWCDFSDDELLGEVEDGIFYSRCPSCETSIEYYEGYEPVER